MRRTIITCALALVHVAAAFHPMSVFVLTIVTIIELAVSYSGLSKVGLIAILFPLSALKFGIVVALFMHLRFDSPFFTKIFLGPLILAASVLLALFILGEYDADTAKSVIFKFRGE